MASFAPVDATQVSWTDSTVDMLCAGGSAKQARDRRFQAILPLRGKILNVEKKDDASLYKNNEISNLILGLGLGLKGEDVTNLRYGKVTSLLSNHNDAIAFDCLATASHCVNISLMWKRLSTVPRHF